MLRTPGLKKKPPLNELHIIEIENIAFLTFYLRGCFLTEKTLLMNIHIVRKIFN